MLLKLNKLKQGQRIRQMDEALTVAQRLARSRIMKAKAGIIAKKREISMNRKATPEKLKLRALKKAKDIIRKKITSGKNPADLSFSEKERIEKMLKKKSAAIKNIAKKLLPMVKKGEEERLKKRREK